MVDRDVAFAVLSNLVRVVVGPISLLLVAKSLSSDELGFYYTFFSLQAASQLLEAGMGFVLMQFIAHKMHFASFSNERLHGDEDAVIYVYGKALFLFLWYCISAILVFFLIYYSALFVFSDYGGVVEWRKAWLAFALTGMFLFVSASQGYVLEGLQNQRSVFKLRIFAGLLYAITLWVSLSLNFGLYSVSIAQAVSAFFYFCAYAMILRNFFVGLVGFSKNNLTVKWLASELKEVWPFFSRISITWIGGYFFWNSLNVVSFKFSGAEFAGQFAMTLAIFRSGTSICESIVSSKQVLYGSLIGSLNYVEAFVVFKKKNIISLVSMVVGTVFVLVLYEYWPNFLREKVLPFSQVCIVALSYVFMLPMLNMALFMRCTKCEPMFYNSAFQNIIMPLGAYCVAVYISPLALPVFFLVLVVFSSVWSFFIFRRFNIDQVCKQGA